VNHWNARGAEGSALSVTRAGAETTAGAGEGGLRERLGNNGIVTRIGRMCQF
jgi:hypothetical protein